MVFDINAKTFFLTYPQADRVQGKEQLLDYLVNKRDGVLYACVAKELHEDGATHYHAVISYGRRYHCTNERYFDYEGCHPNVQAARTFEAVRKYIEKDGDFVAFGELPAPKRSISEVCATSTRVEWEEYCVKNSIAYAYCESFWNREHPKTDTFTILDGHGYGPIGPQLDGFEYATYERALVLVGPTGCGKTSWAIKNSPKPAIMISHLDRLRDYDPDKHKCIIFDDMVFKHVPVQAQIHLVDYHCPRDIHCRYRTACIPAGTAKIFTCNERPFEQHPAINRRIRLYEIKEFP